MFSSLFSPSIPSATLTFCVGIYTRYSLLVSVYAPRFLLPGRLLPVLKQARRGGGSGDLRGGRFASPWLLWDVVLEKNKLPLCSISILYSVSLITKDTELVKTNEFAEIYSEMKISVITKKKPEVCFVFELRAKDIRSKWETFGRFLIILRSSANFRDFLQHL